MTPKKIAPVLSSMLAGLTFVSIVEAQNYPTRPIRLIHGFAAGGQGDTIARILGQEMGIGLGQPIVVEGRPGADGNIATDAVAKSTPDGYMLLLATGAVPVSGAIYKSLPFNTVEDFQWLSTAVLFSFVLSARSDGKFQSIGDLIQAARGSTNAVSFGSGGIGARLAGEMLASVARVKLEGFGFEVQGSTAEEMRNRVASEIQQWRKIIAEAGIQQQP